MEIATLGKRDQFFQLGLDGLGLRLGRLDPLVLDDLLGEVHQQRLAVSCAAAELISLTLVTHLGPGSLPVPERKARACNVSITSSIDFLPKFGVYEAISYYFQYNPMLAARNSPLTTRRTGRAVFSPASSWSWSRPPCSAPG